MFGNKVGIFCLIIAFEMWQGMWQKMWQGMWQKMWQIKYTSQLLTFIAAAQ